MNQPRLGKPVSGLFDDVRGSIDDWTKRRSQTMPTGHHTVRADHPIVASFVGSTGCDGCIHRHLVTAHPFGTSSSGPGCKLTGGHATQRCQSYQPTETAPYVVGSDTSKAAAESIVPELPRLEALVYAFILNSGTDGATSDEIEYGMQMAHQTISARVRGLVLKGRVKDSGARRKTRSGRKATVWVVA